MQPKFRALATALAAIALPAATAPTALARTLEAESVDTAPAAPAETTSTETGRAETTSPEALLAWVVASGDNHGVPFAIVDKLAATVSVYDAAGRLLGSAAVLVGSAIGDHSPPHVGERELSAIRPEERTTPAGRFVASYGRARGHASVLWVDYATAISLHPVVTTNKKERRPERLQSPTTEDNRITYGCINVPAAFYEEVVRPTFKATRAVVYILPDTESVETIFPTFAAARHTRLAANAGP